MEETLRTILCFGDSNTNGCNPEDGTRWPYNVRWTGVMQRELGSGYLVIEEGLGGRTTAFEDPFYPDRKGIDSLPSILETHYPLSLVIIMLGTNDCKSCYSATPEAIAFGMRRIAETINSFPYPVWIQRPRILIVSPIHIGKETDRSGCAVFDHSSHLKSLKLAPLARAEAEKAGASFFDASSVAEPGVDSIHLGKDGHLALGLALAGKVREMLEGQC